MRKNKGLMIDENKPAWGGQATEEKYLNNPPVIATLYSGSSEFRICL
jgi:hypothetical protein